MLVVAVLAGCGGVPSDTDSSARASASAQASEATSLATHASDASTQAATVSGGVSPADAAQAAAKYAAAFTDPQGSDVTVNGVYSVTMQEASRIGLVADGVTPELPIYIVDLKGYFRGPTAPGETGDALHFGDATFVVEPDGAVGSYALGNGEYEIAGTKQLAGTVLSTT